MFLTSLLNAIVSFVGGALTSIAKLDPNVATLPIYQEVSNDLGKYKATEADYMAGQAAVIAPFSHDGKEGVLVAVANGGPAAASLGL